MGARSSLTRRVDCSPKGIRWERPAWRNARSLWRNCAGLPVRDRWKAPGSDFSTTLDWEGHASSRFTRAGRSEEHTSELQSLMRISYADFCLKKKKHITEQSSEI